MTSGQPVSAPSVTFYFPTSVIFWADKLAKPCHSTGERETEGFPASMGQSGAGLKMTGEKLFKEGEHT